MNKSLLEACVSSFESSEIARKAGADRIELCANLCIGGTTPSLALFHQIKEQIEIPTNILIRPRFGDFLYTSWEIDQMCREIASFQEAGADGVVIGILTKDGSLDIKNMRKLLAEAKGMSITLHRAFDMTADPFVALEQAIELGIHTILTSGQQNNAVKGSGLLGELWEKANGRITIMAGSGVKSHNIQEIHRLTNITAFHTSARAKVIDSQMIYRKKNVSMGLDSLSEYEIWQSDYEELKACADIVHEKII